MSLAVTGTSASASPPVATGRAPRSVVLLTGLLALIASAAVLVLGSRPEPPVTAGPGGLELTVFLVAITLAGLLNLRYRYRGEVIAVDLFEAVLALAIFSLPPVHAVAVAAGGKALSEALQRVQPTKAVFNVAQRSAAAAVGCLVFVSLTDPDSRGPEQLPVLALALALVLVISLSSLVAVIALMQRGASRSWLFTAVPQLMRDGLVPGAVNVVWGLLFVATYSWAPVVVPLFAVPLAMLHWANRGYARGRMEQVWLRGLQRATSALGSTSDRDGAVRAFLAEVQRGFGWGRVELVLPEPGGRVVYTASGPDQRPGPEVVPALQQTAPVWQPDTTRTVAAELLARAVPPGRPVRASIRAADDALAALMDRQGCQDVLAASLGERDGVSAGLLCLYDQRSASMFPDREVAMAQALADEVAGALEQAALREAMLREQSTLAHIVRDTSDGVATLDPDGTVHSWNPAFEWITGYGAQEVVGSVGLSVLNARDEHGRHADLRSWSAGEPLPGELAVRTRDGGTRWLSCAYSHTREPAGPGLTRLVLMARDVTEVYRARRVRDVEQAVFERIAAGADLPEVLRSLCDAVAPPGSGLTCTARLEDTGDGWAPQGEAAAVPPGEAAAVPPGEAGTEPPRERVDLDHDQDQDRCWTRPVHDPEGGTLGVLQVRATRSFEVAVPDGGLMERAASLVAMAVDRSRAAGRLARQASYDAVTGLPNRLFFLDRCETALTRACGGGGEVAVLFIDLDRFKVVNDSLGHAAGDSLLAAVGRRLVSALPRADTVARFGGDEFTILCEGPGTPGSAVHFELARRVEQALRAPLDIEGHEVFVTASIGIAVAPGDVSGETLIGDADAAMYRAKARGGNRVEVFDDQMRARATRRMTLQNAMHRALERGEFEVHYQPLVSLADDTVTGAEALLRWRHPDLGLLAPGHYIDLAESSGLIVPIGEHVLRTACAQVKQWQHAGAGRPPTMSINLSARQFIQPDLTAMVADALTDSGVDPASISLEITESSAMDDAGATVAVMQSLKDLGVQLTLDDFGTGYSSLTYLKRFPVSGLKVDRSFVAGLGSDAEDTAIVSAVIDLAHSLGIVAVAEGVETVEQVGRLKSMGCDTAQGYHFSRPRPAATF